jgi:wobble nucleotide-excising tRNase
VTNLKIDLSTHPTRFQLTSTQLYVSKRVNFIFGKNGTGKTTITDELKSQFSGEYNVCVFKDFEGVAENNRLNAVALGAENADIQEQIDEIDNQIAQIRDRVEKPEDGKPENLYTNAQKTRNGLIEQNKKIEAFYSNAAQQIKNINNPPVASPSYNKNSFQDDIPKANLLSEAEIVSHKKIIKADKKAELSSTKLPPLNMQGLLSSTNSVLGSSIKQPQSIAELKDSPAKQNFAKRGMEVHEHKKDEVCAFCGHSISEERWVMLGNYFNDEVKVLEGRVQSGRNILKQELGNVNKTKLIGKSGFYDKFGDQVDEINLKIQLRKKEAKEFLENLEAALGKKTDELFAKTDPITMAIPANFEDLQTECDQLVKRNNEMSLNLKNEQNEARNALRYHEVKKLLGKFKFADENIVLEGLRVTDAVAQANLNDQKIELALKRKARAELILKTKDEEAIARKISELLASMGIASFSLVPIDDAEGQKGQYQIKGHDNKIRPITDLSRGEKNIIALLYFLFSLDEAIDDQRPKIIVLDDPMTSNDDTMQYLMIGEIKKFYENLSGEDVFVLLTHNCHFYLNVRPRAKGLYKDYGIYRLYSDGKRTKIGPITNGKQDFRTSYETLWQELVFLYEADEPNLMLSPCRRICDTYVGFTKKSSEVFYGENTNARKLFDVNQHSIDDLEAEQNGKTRDEIKQILQTLFKENSAEEHFNNYWKEA